MSAATLWRALRALGWTREKKHFAAAERDEAERAAWWVEHAGLDPAQIVSVDEGGSNPGHGTALRLVAQRRARGAKTATQPRGQHHAAAPRSHPKDCWSRWSWKAARPSKCS